jgi:hypothetical protein
MAISVLGALTGYALGGCIDSDKPETKRSIEKLTKVTTYGEAAHPHPAPPAGGEKRTLAKAQILGEPKGDAEIIREGARARIVVSVKGAPKGHYEVELARGLACRFDPTERAGGLSSDSQTPVAAAPRTEAEHHARFGAADGISMSENPLSVGEIHVGHWTEGHLEATIDSRDLPASADRYQDMTILIRKAGPAHDSDLASEATSCGRFKASAETEEPQG